METPTVFATLFHINSSLRGVGKVSAIGIIISCLWFLSVEIITALRHNKEGRNTAILRREHFSCFVNGLKMAEVALFKNVVKLWWQISVNRTTLTN